MDNLPNDWKLFKLGELVKIRTGKLDSNAMIVDGRYPFFTCSREIFSIDEFAFDCEAILLAGNNASGDFNVKHYKGKFNAYQRTYVITVNDEAKLLYVYLKHQLINNLKVFKEQSVGANTKFLKIGMIQGMNIPLPPLSEQTRIVAKLDALFARIDKSIALLEENIKHTKALMASVLEEVFRDSENKWKFKPLKTATSKIGSGSTPRGGQSAYQSFGISLIRSMNVHDGEFRHTGLAFIDDAQARKLQSVSIEKDDVLLNITGASVARCSIVDESILPARVNQHVSIIRTKSILNPHFLQAYLICPATKSKLIFNSSGGATREAITKTMIENLEVPIPSIQIQENIIHYIQQVKEANLKILVEQQSKLVYLKSLRSSLLDRAFKGEL